MLRGLTGCIADFTDFLTRCGPRVKKADSPGRKAGLRTADFRIKINICESCDAGMRPAAAPETTGTAMTS